MSIMQRVREKLVSVRVYSQQERKSWEDSPETRRAFQAGIACGRSELAAEMNAIIHGTIDQKCHWCDADAVQIGWHLGTKNGKPTGSMLKIGVCDTHRDTLDG